jgi:branched-chain amino acid transport system substrate-binding protein
VRKTTTVVLLAAALVVAACGTRLPDEAFVEDGQLVGAEEQAAGDGGAVGVDDGDAGTDGATATTAPADAGGGTTGGTDGGTTGGTTGGSATGGDGGSGGTDGGGGPNQASDIGITADTIVIGNITAENGVLGDTFAPAARGMRAWAQHVNATGGINGRQIVLKTCDDGEVRNKALECARKLVEQDKAFAIVGANTRALGGAAQYLHDQGIPVIGFPITNSYYRYPHFWSVYPFGYPRDGKTVGFNGQLMATSAIYRWFRTHLEVTKAAVFFYDIDESRQAGTAFAEGLKAEGFEVTPYPVSFAAPSFDQAVADMQRNGVQIIFDSMDDGANRKLCDAMARRRFTVAAKVSTVVSFGEKVGTTYNDTCRNNVFIPGDSIPYTATNVPAVAEFRNAFAKYQPGKELHQWALEAWAQGKLVAEGIASMGAAPTRKGLEDFFRGLDRYTAGGIFVGLDWRPEDYAAPTREDCFTIARWQDAKGGWVQATETFPFCYPDAKQYGSPALEQGN